MTVLTITHGPVNAMDLQLCRALTTELPALDTLFRTVFTLDVPVVAAVGGHAVAGGAVPAAAADHVLMAEGRGRFGVPEPKVGVAFPQSALGLVDEVVDGDSVIDRAVAVAAELATSAPADAYALTERQLRRDRVLRIAGTDITEVLEMWCRRVEDGWTARYLERATGGR